MDKLKPYTIIFALFAVFLAIGAVYVYCNDCGSYSADARMNSDGTVTYSISGPASNYEYSVFSDTKKVDSIYLFYDESYVEFFNNDYAQKEYFNVLKQMLERRGATVAYANAKELVDVMSNGNNAVVFVTGALPDTVYGDSDIFVKWMEKGGTVYWSGPEIGRYVLKTNETKDLGSGFFEGKVDSDDKKKMAYNASPMFEFTQTRYDNCSYGLSVDVAGSKPLAFVSDDGFSSVSVARLYSGNVTVFGGNMALLDNVSQAMTDRTCVADLMICGLTYESEGLDHACGELTSKITSTTTKKFNGYGDVAIRFIVGEPSSHWGKCIRL